MKSEIQAIYFMKPIWTKQMAKQYLKLRGLHPIKSARIYGKEIRYRLQDPKQYDHFTTQKTNDQIYLVLGWK